VINLFKLNLNAVYSVAKKEFADNVRSKWIIGLIIIFIIMALLASYLAGAQEGQALGNMQETVLTLMSIAGILVPLIAIMLGYAAISGECESGSMGILLSYPLRRVDILVGKIIGLGLVIVVSTVAGFGLSGIAIAAAAGTESGLSYLAFIGYTILTGFLYLSMSIMFSSFAKRRTTSLGLGVVLFFWSMIYGMIVFGLYAATGGDVEGLFVGAVDFPHWLWASVVFSPMDMYQMGVWLAFDIDRAFGVEIEAPWFFTETLVVMVHILWIEIALVLSYFFFEKRDI
jgi:ABC-type transport system involved in multi-copper enzyme maturation permease subunit